jgi:hypothetical protein
MISDIPTPSDDRALSDLIGFILTFTVIVAAVGLISTTGLTMLTELQQSEQSNNAERAFEVMAGNLQEIERGKAPRRSSEMNLHSGDISLQNDSEFTYEVDGTNFETTVAPRQIVYRSEDDIIVYENSAVFRSNEESDGQGVLQTAPVLTCNDDRATVSIVRLDGIENVSYGSGSIAIETVEQSSRILYPLNRTGNKSATDGDQLNITIDSPYSKAWETYFETSESDWEPTPGPSTFACEDVDRIYIRETVIEVRFTR